MNFMKEALKEAKKAYLKGEVPVGAIIVHEGKIIARAHNLRQDKQKVTAHAEIIAIEKASKKIGSWRLEECTLYVTLEPCPMCSGAIIQARIKEVVFGAYDKKAGCAGSVLDMFYYPLTHRVIVTGGEMEEEAKELLQHFFKEIRLKKKQQDD